VLSQVSERLDATLGESYRRNIRQPQFPWNLSLLARTTSSKEEKAGRRALALQDTDTQNEMCSDDAHVHMPMRNKIYTPV